MFDTIKNLKKGDMITIDSKQSYNFTNYEDFEISSIDLYQSDDSNAEYVMLEFDNDYFLIAHTFNEEAQYFIVEINDEIRSIDEDDCPEKIVIKQNKSKTRYTLVDDGWKYFNNANEEVAICEYANKDNVLIIEQISGNQTGFQGIAITESHLVI